MVATRTAPHSRLPGGEPTGSRRAEILRGLLALLAILVIVVGVPVALSAGFGTPWPDQAPSSDWIYADFTPRDVLAILVGVVWLAWLHFCVCLMVEFVAERRGRGLSPHVPGGSVGTQPLARRLVSAVLLLAGGLAATMPAATAVTSGLHAEDTQARPSVIAQAAPDAGGLGRADTARHPAPDRQDGPAAFTEADGKGLHKYVEVQPPEGRHYDTMWGIAERYLGNGLRYKEIVRLNEGVTQPDGTTLKNPDLIYPGWILKLPADATGPGLRSVEHEPRTQDPGPKHDGHGRHDAGDRDGTPTVSNPDAGPGDGGGGTEQGGGGSNDASMTAIGGFSTAGALLAAGLLLNLRRRRGWDGGPSPRGGKQLDHEFDLRGTADESSATFIDRVLRSLGQALPDGHSLPAPTSAVLGVDGLAVTFPAETRVRLASPWAGDVGGRTWVVDRSDAHGLRPEPGALSPLPGLVALGRRGDVETLIDVESVGGVISISGDLSVARDIVVGLGLALATNRWSDSPRVTFVGFADDLSELAPGQIRHYDELPEVFEIIDAKRRRQHSACAAHGFDSVRAGRVEDADARLWAPEFVILSGVPGDADVKRLHDIATDPRNAVGVIAVGDVKVSPARMVAASDGTLWCGPLGIDVAAHRVSAETYRDALSVFDAEFATGGSGDDPNDPSPAALAAPVVDPDCLDVTEPMAVEITSLGHVRVTGPGEVDEARRDLLTELIVYLALHPEGIHPNVLSAAIWPRGVSDDVRDSALAQVATWLGTDESATPRLNIDAQGRWRLARGGLRFDWDVFRALANRAATGSDALGDLELALTLVTGAAWTGLPARRYGWLAYETVEADARVAVVAVARRLAQLAAAAGDPLRSRNALLSGLRMSPACEEIWRDALSLANRYAGPADVRAVADDMYAAISRQGSLRGPQPETDALVDELLPGYRRNPAA